MSRILISGAGGFVGRNLVTYLNSKGINTKQLTRDRLHNIEVSDFNDCKGVIHLAGKAHDLKRVSDPKEYYDINYELTKNIYDSFLKSESSVFIFVSSVKAAADSVQGVLTEDQACAPQTHYGKSKRMAEEYIINQKLPVGKSYFILRPCMIHGPGNKGNLNLLYQLVKKGIPYPLAGFLNKRSFLSVGNLTFVMQELVSRSDIPSGIYQVADDEPLSTNEVVKILSASLEKRDKLWAISPWLIKLVASLGDKIHLPLTTERLNKLTESYVVSNGKIKMALNKPFPISVREGLKTTSLSFKEL